VRVAASGVTVDLGGARILDEVDVEVAAGAWLAIVGPNGAGKSTLLRVIAGTLSPRSGTVTLGDRDAATLHRRERARQIALVPQAPIVPPGMAVADYVLLGRTPHLHPLAAEGPADLAAARDAMDRLDLLDLAGRELGSLSGGERQRAFLARALAQEAPVLLLDEPTTALDVGHQQQVLELVDDLRRHDDLTVVTTLHDLTSAGQYADRLVLLDRGRVVVDGGAPTVLTEEHLSRFYGASVRVIDDGGRPVVVPVRPTRGAHL
jgi:iron complex transport system ATP-binding protein